MNCEFQKYIDSYLNGNLSENKEKELLNHADKCPECSKKLKAINDIENMLKTELSLYPYKSNKNKIIENAEKKKNKVFKLYIFKKSRKFIYTAAAILIIGISLHSLYPSSINLKSPKLASTQDFKNTNINYDDIKWVSQEGGLPGKGFKVLFSGKDSDTIKKIVNLINNNNGIVKVDEKDIGNQLFSMARPVSIIMYSKNEIKYRLSYFYTITTTKTSQGTETSFIPTNDKSIFTIENNGEPQYYIINSENLAKYLKEQRDIDIPRIDVFSCVTSDIKTGKKISEFTMGGSNKIVNGGEKISITGDGATNKEVNIVLLNRIDNKERYVIGKVTTDFGKWRWEGIVDKNAKAIDGNPIEFKSSQYVVSFESGDINRSGYCSDIIDISK